MVRFLFKNDPNLKDDSYYILNLSLSTHSLQFYVIYMVNSLLVLKQRTIISLKKKLSVCALLFANRLSPNVVKILIHITSIQ